MKTLVEAQPKIAKAWGTAKVKDEVYRLNRYLLRADAPQGLLLHHVVTGQLILLDAEEAAALEALPARPGEVLTPLIQARFLVPENFDEKKSVQQLRKLLQKLNWSKGVTGYTILPTTCCNARCFYCYEADYRHISMTEETAHRLVEYMDAHRGGSEHLHLSWFGGEPTLGVNRIDQICRELEERGIKYSSSMISNGYLFSPELAQKAKELWKLTNIQITLDGTEEIYNRVKSYVNVPGSPYQRVMDNIGHLLDQEIRVSIRMNMDRHNRQDLEALADELAARYGGRKGFSAYVHELFDDEGYDPVHHTEEDKAWLTEAVVALNRRLAGKEMYADRWPLPALKTNSCMADNDGSLIVSPDGHLGKCEHYCDSNFAGSLWDEAPDPAVTEPWKEAKELPQCGACPLYPECYYLKQCPNPLRCTELVQRDKIERYQKEMLRRAALPPREAEEAPDAEAKNC